MVKEYWTNPFVSYVDDLGIKVRMEAREARHVLLHEEVEHRIHEWLEKHCLSVQKKKDLRGLSDGSFFVLPLDDEPPEIPEDLKEMILDAQRDEVQFLLFETDTCSDLSDLTEAV